MDSLYQQMMNTAANAGLAVMSRDKAAKLLAACYVYGDEPFVLASKLHTDTMLAVRILQMEPGVIPPQESKKKLNRYYREIVTSDNVPGWLSELGAEYGVTFPPYWRK